MARECIRNCWRIQQILKNMDSDNMWAGPMAFHPDLFSGDDSEANRLLAVCEASYECPGPSTTEVEVVKGFIRKHAEMEQQPTCQIPDRYLQD